MVFAELISEGNVLVTGVWSLPSLGLAVAAGMMAVGLLRWESRRNAQVENVYRRIQVRVPVRVRIQVVSCIAQWWWVGTRQWKRAM